MQDQDRPGWNPPAEPTSAPLASQPEAPAAAPRRSRVGTGVAIAAIAVGGLGVAGTAYAASSSPTPSPSAGTGAPSTRTPGQPGPRGDGDGPQGQGGMPGMGRHGGPGGMGGGLGMGLGGAIHGSFVTPKQGGGYQTVEAQRGKVTAVSSTSITVTSDDGFVATYVVTADTVVNATRDGIASVRVGDEVGVTAIKGTSDSTAVMIVDRTGIDASRRAWAPPRPGGPTGATGASGATGTA